MHYARQIRICLLLLLWIAASGCDTAKTAINGILIVAPDVLSTIAKTVASALSPTLIGELQSNRTNRSSVTLVRALQDKRLDELDTSSTSNGRIGRPVSAPLNPDASFYAEGSYNPSYLRRIDGARSLLDGYFGPVDGNYVPARGVQAPNNSPSIDLKRLDDLQPHRGVLGEDPQLGAPFTKFGENNYDRSDTRFLASPIRENSRPYFAPFGFGGHYLPHGGYHGYPHHPYNGQRPSEQPTQPDEGPASENQETEGSDEPTDGKQPNQPPGGYNHGYHHGYKHFGFDPYGPYHYPGYPGHPNFYYPGHRPHPDQNPPEGENANAEEADGGSTPKNQQPGYPNFYPPYVNFHLQGYPAPPYGIYPYDRFHNVHNKNGTELPPGSPYGAPFSPFPPFHNFYLPGSKKPNNQDPATTTPPGNPDAERIADKVSSSESRFDEIVGKIEASQLAANGIPLSAYASKRLTDRHPLIDRYLLAGGSEAYENLSNLQ